jgi:primary-amine oxidase
MTQLSQGAQPQLSMEELLKCETVVRNSPLVRKVAAEIGASCTIESLATID